MTAAKRLLLIWLLVSGTLTALTAPAAAQQLQASGPELVRQAGNTTASSCTALGPVEVGYYDTPGSAQDVAVAGDYAYVANQATGLRIIDVSNPRTPAEVGFFDTGGTAYGVDISGTYAYVADGDSGLRVIDVSNPVAPTEVGFCDTAGTAYGVVVAGGLAYVADGGSGLRIIDVSVPTAPAEVGFLDTAGLATSVAFASGYAYVADRDDGLRIIDVSDPHAPHEAGFLDTAGVAIDVAVAGGYAYVADVYDGVRIVDVSDPASPAEAGSYKGEAYTVYVGSVAAVGNLVYAGGTSFQGRLDIINAAYPAAPVVLGTYELPGTAGRMTVVGQHAFIADGESGLRIVNVCNPVAPFETAFEEAPDGVYEVAVQGQFAYALGFPWVLGAPLHIFSVADPAHPTRVSTYRTPAYADDVEVSGRYAYVAAMNMGLRVIDVSDPSAPSETGLLAGQCAGLAIVGKHAYLAGGWALHIVSFVNPAAPSEIGLYAFQGLLHDVRDVWVSGANAYVASGDEGGGIYVVNIANPVAPVSVGTWSIPGYVGAIEVAGNLAYVANGDLGLRILDVANPAAPVELARFDTAGDAVGVDLFKHYAYVADHSRGLAVIDVTNPAAPLLAGVWQSGWAEDIVVSGDYAYVASYGELTVVDILRDKVIAVLPQAGGSVASNSADTAFVFPQGAFTQTVTLTYRHYWTDKHPGNLAGIGHTFDLSGVYAGTTAPVQLAPGKTFTATVHYSDAELGSAIEDTLALYSWDGSSWSRESTSSLDTASNVVTAAPAHFSLWAVFGETHPVFLPLVLKRQ
jgi:hypothetical protein